MGSRSASEMGTRVPSELTGDAQSPRRKVSVPQPPPPPIESDDDRLSHNCTFAVQVHNVQNIPLDPGELVRIAWEGLHQEGVTPMAHVSSDHTAVFQHEFYIKHRVPKDGPKKGQPAGQVHLCLQRVQPNCKNPVTLDRMSLNLATQDPVTGRMGISSSKRIVFTVQFTIKFSGLRLDVPELPDFSGASDNVAAVVADLQRQLNEAKQQLHERWHPRRGTRPQTLQLDDGTAFSPKGSSPKAPSVAGSSRSPSLSASPPSPMMGGHGPQRFPLPPRTRSLSTSQALTAESLTSIGESPYTFPRPPATPLKGPEKPPRPECCCVIC